VFKRAAENPQKSPSEQQKLSDALAVFRTFRLRQSFQRPYGKEFVATGVATKRRKTEQTSDGAQSSRHIFRRNPLEVEIAADGAMGVTPMTYR
jgi:hypothetical protein